MHNRHRFTLNLWVGVVSSERIYNIRVRFLFR